MQAGRLAEAAQLYAKLLKAQPKHPGLLFEAGGVALQQGRPEQAAHLFARLVRLQPAHADAWCNLGQAHARQDRYPEALKAYRQAVALRPDFPGGHYNIAMAEQALGNLPAALAAYDVAVAQHPAFAEAHNNRGNVLASLGRYEEALQSFDSSLRHWPQNVEAWHNHGLMLQTLGRHRPAVTSFRRALSLHPAHAEAWRRCALSCQALPDVPQAVACLDQVLRLQPGRADVHALRAGLLHELGDYPQAAAAYRQALRHGAPAADLLIGLAKVLLLDKQHAQSLQAAEQAVALEPANAHAHNVLGAARHALQLNEPALASLQQAISLYPHDPVFHNNLALVLEDLRRFPAAFASYDQALGLDPEYADGWWNRALLHLLLGQFAPGWRLYEWRRRQPSAARAQHARPLWLGETPLHGRSILVAMEQGQGDFIQFCRYVPLLAAQAAQVVLETPPSLLGLAATLPASNLLVVAHGQPLPATDCYCPLLSLPLAFATTLASIPASVPYLHPLPSAALPPSSARPRVGLVWSGSPGHARDHLRSMAFAELLPLLDLPCEFHVLQQDVRGSDLPQLQNRIGPVLHRHSLPDFTATAALLQQMDLLLSVDTSVAHLAGALARPLWLLLPYAPDFRWLLERRDSPWYPSARLFRQPAPGGWPAVVAQVRQALSAWLAVGV